MAPLVVGLVILAVWTFWVDVLGTAPRMLPSPVAIVEEFVLRFPIILDDMTITATNALVGHVVGSLLALLFAGLAAAAKPVDGMLAPLVSALAVIPIVAITPILNTMFGASSQFGRQAALCANERRARALCGDIGIHFHSSLSSGRFPFSSRRAP